jgi:hypothetical protein
MYYRPDVTPGEELIFGKNSDRPRGEVQNVMAFPAQPGFCPAPGGPRALVYRGAVSLSGKISAAKNSARSKCYDQALLKITG